MYADESYYTTEYGGKMVPSADFGRLARRAGRIMDSVTLNKLRFAFPTEEYDVTAVKDCMCELVEFLYQVEQYNASAMQSVGVAAQSDGTVKGKVISSISSGSESVGYSVGGNIGTSVSEAAKSEAALMQSASTMIRTSLSGVRDANGVFLLYAGIPYPGKRGAV